MLMRPRLFTPLAVAGLAVTVSAAGLELQVAGSYRDGLYDEGAAEIVAVDLDTKQLFVVNGGRQRIDVLSAADIFHPSFVSSLDLGSDWAPNSVAVKNGIVAIASGFAPAAQAAGAVHFYSASTGSKLGQVTVGALPDMLTFTPDGMSVLVANEGEPNDAYTVDPEGSISVIDISGLDPLSGDDDQVSQSAVMQLEFDAFNNSIHPDVRIFGPGATVSQDLEPEYIAIGANGKAYVSLQENNALAVVDLASKTVTDIVPLGFKDWSTAGSGLDADRNDDAAVLAHLPIFGMYQPDSIATYEVGGQTYIVSANEGDSRDYDGFSEEVSLDDVTLDTATFPDAATLQDGGGTGDLKITSTLGDTDGDGDLDAIYAYGGRSFSIWDADGNLVWDSGSMIEAITAADPQTAAWFNASNTNNTIDNRSDDKGPEPEALVLGEIDGRMYAFLGLERVGGIMMFDITDPNAPVFIDYLNNRDFTVDTELAAAGDLGPEGLVFIGAGNLLDPDGLPLLIAANEISGTTTIYRIVPEPATLALLSLGGLVMLRRTRA